MPYKWQQQLADVDISVPVPKGTRARDLNVVIGKKKLSVAIKNQEPIMGGELCKDIKVEESTWSIGGVFHLQMFSAYKVIRGPVGGHDSP